MFQVLNSLPALLIAGSLIGMIVFVTSYAQGANWRTTAAGRGLMYLMASMIAILALAVVHAATGVQYPYSWVPRVVVNGMFFASIWRLVFVLYGAQKMSLFSWLGFRRINRKKRSER